jgi:mannosyltransferase OCH1-like enzyme
MTIPKIIHQTAPRDKEKWNPIWEKCHESWKSNFSPNEFDHVMWTDEDIDNLVKDKYPDYYDVYKKFPLHILQIDFVRNCILDQYGGIYADMDMYCYENFYNDLKKDIVLLGALSHDEVIQNALMCSSKQSSFFKLCAESTIQKFNIFPPLNDLIISSPNLPENIIVSEYVKEITGPYMLSHIYNAFQNKDEIQILSQKEYNPIITEYHSRIKTKHMLTGDWGKEHKNNYDNSFISYKNFKKFNYFKQRGIDIDLYNFK